MTVPPEANSLRDAVDDLGDAARAFDERLTGMVTVQRRLIRVLRQLDPDELAAGPQTTTELIVELRDLAEELRGHAERPSSDAAPAVPGQPARTATSSARVDRERDLAEVLRELFAADRVDVAALRTNLFGRDHRDVLPLLADELDRLERNERLATPPLSEMPLSELLCLLNNVGPQRADRILEDAELPPSVAFGDLGPADVDRLARTLRRYTHGFTRSTAEAPPDAQRGQDPVTSSYGGAGDAVAEAFIAVFGADAPAFEDALREALPLEGWPDNGLDAAMTLLEWGRADVLGAVDEAYVVGRPVDSPSAAADLGRHLRPIRSEAHSQWRDSDADEEDLLATFARQQVLDEVVAAANEVNSAHELEQTDPLRRRQRATPRTKCEDAARHIGRAARYAPISDEQLDQLIERLGGLLASDRDVSTGPDP